VRTVRTALTATLGFVALLVPSAHASGTIRVALLENTRAVELHGVSVVVNELDGSGADASAWRTDIIRAVAAGPGVEIDGRRARGFRLTSERPIQMNGREYPGALEVVRSGEGLAVVNELPLEDYLVGVLRAEASERWPLEMLRAQAIVARTYAAYHRLLNALKPYHIVASTVHQAYVGSVPSSSPVWDVVRGTRGQVLLWEGGLFPAFYHSASGGYTEDPRTVFAAPNMPALKAIRDEFSTGAPYYAWSLVLRLSDLSEILRRNGFNIGWVKAVEVTERTPSLRVSTLTVHGTRGRAPLRGNDFRRMVGYEMLKSTLFAVAVDGTSAHFAGRGYGHGVGMSQWGAKAMAERGYRAETILEFYYPGTTLGVLDDQARTALKPPKLVPAPQPPVE
jgi:stage II sporulation protein D